jgi:hypothetical protein
MRYFMSYFVAGSKVRHTTLCRTLWQEAKYDILLYVVLIVAWCKVRHTFCHTLWQEAKYDILYVVLCGRVQSTTYIMPPMAALLYSL